jgi:thiamine-monophosphate kinase
VAQPASEFALIDRHFRRPARRADVRVGIGDDAAVVAPTPGMELAISVDMLVEGRHFFAGTDAAALGHKSLAVNLSDLAAMGARARYALLAGALPDADEAWLARFMQGFRALADRHDVELIGGDTTRGPRNVCVTVIGEVPPGGALTRAGARAGDDIYVSGTLGGAALAVAALHGDIALDQAPLAQARMRLERPTPRLALGVALRGIASAAIDVSDGLTGDLGHILDMSHCGAVVDLERVPADASVASQLRGPQRALALRCLLAGGDDYELCFTAPADGAARVAAAAQSAGVPCTSIGQVTADGALRVRDRDGRVLPALPAAFDHFAG